MLREQLEKSGEYLFRKRSYVPLVLYIISTAAILLENNSIVTHGNIFWSITCLFISLLGLFIRVMTIGYVPRNTSGRNTSEGQIAETINTSGMYSLVRHPLYLGNFFMWMGLILYVAIPWVIIFSVAFFWFLYERIMLAEEKYIREKFSDEFDRWAQKTPAFFPRSLKWIKSRRKFSAKKVMRREYSGILALSISFVYIDVLKNISYFQRVDIHKFWMIAGIAGIVIWFVLRSLRKWTNVLKSSHQS